MGYLEEVDEKLQAARKRVRQGRQVRALKAAAPDFFEIIDNEITLAVNKMTQNTPLDYESYLSAHGQVVGIRKIRDLLNSKEVEEVHAAQEVQGIETAVKQFKDDAKQK